MNFLSHYYFDRHCINPYEVLGMVLPDLIKNADKTWNLHPEKNEYLFLGNKNQEAILKGWKRHLLVDRIFHNSDFFKYHQHHIKLLISPSLKDSPVKPFFIGHISLELILDSLLLTENIIQPNSFYNYLAQVNHQELSSFLIFNDLPDNDKFFRFFTMFNKEQYISSYDQPDKITYAIKRICMRIWRDPFTREQEDALLQNIINYKNELTDKFIFIFDLIDAELN